MAARTAELGRWAARPRLALLVRVLVLVVPVAFALLAAVTVALLLPPPGSPRGQVGWWLAVLATSTLVLVLADRLARRALPLAVLLELSLVFPDRAPSRLRAARTGSVAQLERTVDRLRRDGVDTPAVEAAETLVVLVGILGLHDKRTRGHCERVRALTDLLTEELGLDDDDRAKVRWAALVHDLGKLRVPVSVLNGGKDLAEDEWEALRRHPEGGTGWPGASSTGSGSGAARSSSTTSGGTAVAIRGAWPAPASATGLASSRSPTASR